MRTLKFLTFIFVLYFSTSALARNPDSDYDSAVKQTITNYLSGIDSRNSDAVGQLLYSDATVLTVNNISNKTNRLTAGDVVTRIKGGSMGGWKREVNFGSIDANDKTAMVKVEVSDSKVKQTSFVTLINDNGAWKIVSEVSVLNQNK